MSVSSATRWNRTAGIYCEGSPTSASSFEWFVDTFLRPAAGADSASSVYDLCNAAIARTDPDEPPVYIPAIPQRRLR